MKLYKTNIEISDILKWVKRVITSRAFVGSLVFATALWFYTKLSEPYNEFVRVPLNVILPENRAIEEALPPTVSVKVKGTGWDLFNLYSFNTGAKCEIDFSKQVINDSIVTINRTELLSGLQQFQQCEPIDIFPESMELLTGKIESREIRVVPDITVNTREGFLLIGEIASDPQRIKITGNEKAIMKIDSWRSRPEILNDVYYDLSIKVGLLDSLKNVVRFDQRNVKVNLNIEQEAEIIVQDIPIVIKGGSLPKNYKIIPSIVSVSFRGGVDQLADFPTDKISAFVNFIDIIDDSTGVAIPEIVGADGLILLNQQPRYVRVVKSISTVKEVPVVF
jgi:YbbR domain-containing protein